MNAKAARAIKTVFYALDVVNQGMQEKQSITVRCMDIEDLEKQADVFCSFGACPRSSLPSMI